MIASATLAPLADKVDHLLAIVDALVPGLDTAGLAALTPAARDQRALLIAASIDLEASARGLREAGATPASPAGTMAEAA